MSGIPALLAFCLVVIAITWAATALLQRYRPNISRYRRVNIGGGIASGIIFLLGMIAAFVMSSGSSPDAGGFVFAGVLLMTAISLPLGIATSTLVTRLEK